jgi:hypothetical protein
MSHIKIANSVAIMANVQKELLSEARSEVLSAQKRRLKMLDDNTIKKHFKKRKYLHFDKSINFKTVYGYVTNQDKIALHGFLPLLYYVDKTEKFIGQPNPKKDGRPIKEKTRDIMYAGHLDNYIYKYYSLVLNLRYNQWVDDHEIDVCSIAYRDNKPNQSNINFAAEVINEIVNYKEAFIFVGDFTRFFDKIDHRILKKNLIRVLDKTQPQLPNDWYNIYRSITKHGYYVKEELNEILGSDRSFKTKKLCSYFENLKEFREFQKQNKPKYNKEMYGIPQGTALSGVFANVYAIDFDFEMQKIANRYNGLYRRYSDDFILIVPKKSGLPDFKNIVKKIESLAVENRIDIQKEKTHQYKYTNSVIINLSDGSESHINYLGFIFDGKTVRIRGKSPYKFYRNAYILINKAKQTKAKKELKKLPYRKRSGARHHPENWK